LLVESLLQKKRLIAATQSLWVELLLQKKRWIASRRRNAKFILYNAKIFCRIFTRASVDRNGERLLTVALPCIARGVHSLSSKR
jgi:hypothetical protein